MSSDLFKAARSSQTITSTWDPIKPPPIDGVRMVDVKNVVFRSGVLTEIFRSDWFEGFNVKHVVHVSLLPGSISQWHCHQEQLDIVFPVRGQIRIGLYDDRPDSATRGEGCVLDFNLHRPRYVFVPPGVWHSVKNADQANEAAYLVCNDTLFDYEAPDDWTLAAGAAEIPVSLD